MSRKILEILWLILAILALAAGIYETFTGTFRESYRFFLIFLLAIVIFLLRRNRRRKNS